MGSVIELEFRLAPKMRAALDGDAAAYRSLLAELRPHLARYFARRLAPGLAHAAEDLVQETLIALHTRRATWTPEAPLTVWVHAIARYKLIDHLRRMRIRATVPIEDSAAMFAAEPELDPTAARDVATVLATLPPRPAELIRRVRIEGASIAEAATATGMSVTAAKVSIHRGLKALAARFGGGPADDR